MIVPTRVFGLILIAATLLASCEQLGWQRIPAAEEPVPLPSIEWVAPAIGTSLSGSVTFRVEAVGDAEFLSVDFTVNGLQVGSSTTGVLTFNSDLLQLAPGVIEASATATNSEGDTFTANRFFVVMDADKPMLSWVAPLVLRDFAPFEPIDIIVDVADASGTITSLVYMIDGNVVETQTNLTDVDTVERITYRWTPGFWVSLDRNVTLRVIATNADGGVTEITREIVSIPPRLVIPDTQAPDAWWQQSTVWNNMAVARTVTLRAIAEDNVQVAFFDFYINGALRERTAASSTNSTLPRRFADFVWDTLVPTSGTDGQLSSTDQRLYPDGVYTVSVEAVDTSGNRSLMATVTVRVANDDTVAPTAAWTYFRDTSGISYSTVYDGVILSGTTVLLVSGTDNVQVQEFEFLVGNARVGTVTASSGQAEISWDTTEVANGIHILGLVAIDQAGNRSERVNLEVRVLNAPTFVLLPSRASYVSSSDTVLSDAESISDTRITPIYLTVQPMDASLGLTVCAVTLNAGLANTSTNISNTDFIRVSASDTSYDWFSTNSPTNRRGLLYPVSWINDAPISATDLNEFELFPESGNYRFVWNTEHELRVWIPDIGSALVVKDVANDTFTTLRDFSPDLVFSATVGVSHSASGCAASNQTQITFFETQTITITGGSNISAPGGGSETPE